MVRYIFLFAVTLLAAFAALAPAARAVDLPIDGGPGGGPFRIRCGPGSFITGFEGRTGAYIDHFRIRCGAFDANTRQITPRGALPITIGTSGGGGSASAACPNGWAVFTIQFASTRDHFIHHIDLRCAPPTGPETIWRTYGPTTPIPSETGVFTTFSAPPAPQVCPPFEFAVGIQGRSGLYVDALGLICEPLPAAPPPPPPKVAAVAPPPAPPPPVSDDPKQASNSNTNVKRGNYTGTWNMRTDKGWNYTITFEQNGRNVIGTFVAQNNDKGRISGRARDGVLEFKWSQEGGFTGTGQIALTADGNSFSGSYRTDPNKKITDPSYLQGVWNGTRQ